jgi:hypothetical protein
MKICTQLLAYAAWHLGSYIFLNILLSVTSNLYCSTKKETKFDNHIFLNCCFIVVYPWFRYYGLVEQSLGRPLPGGDETAGSNFLQDVYYKQENVTT